MMKEWLFKLLMKFRLRDKNECTTCYGNGYHQCIVDIREGELVVYTAKKPCCEVHHDEPLVCLRCIHSLPPLQIVPETPKRPCLEYFGKVNERINTIVESDTETLPHLSMRQMEELLARHKEAS